MLQLWFAVPVGGQEAATRRFEIPDESAALEGVGPLRRYPWFRNLWDQRRSRWADSVQNDKAAVVFLGDSITQGWENNLSRDFPGVKVANRGISGDTTRGMLIRLEGDVLALEPSAVVLLAGTNDLEEKGTTEQISQNMADILDRLHGFDPKMPIVLCKVFPSSSKKKRPTKAIQDINAAYTGLCQSRPYVTLIDTFTLFANQDGDAKVEEFPDLLHPNERGYAKWRKALWPAFATLGFVDKEPEQNGNEAGFRPLFNGKNLDGWCFRPTTEQQKKARARWQKNNPAAPPWPIVQYAEDFDGMTSSSDGRFRAIAGRLVATTPPGGRRIQQIWTQEEFNGDFTLRLEFRTTPNSDSGVFLRGKQLQCRDFHLAGPYKDLKNYRPGEWNSLEITVKNDSARCLCNSELLEENLSLPETGPIGLEGDRGQVEYRKIRLRRD